MKPFLSLFIALCTATITFAQGQYRIEGEMFRDSLRFSPKRIEKVYLTRQVDGVEVRVDSVAVRNRSFSFSGTAPSIGEIYFIQGFDNGSIPVFLEEGHIRILPFDGHFPISAKVCGTPNNDILVAFAQKQDSVVQSSVARRQELENRHKEINHDEATFRQYERSLYHSNTMRGRVATMQFVKQHLNYPVTLYLMRYNLFHLFSPKVVERQLLRAVPPALRQHPLYLEMVNLNRAADLKVGTLAPDFEGTTFDGQKLRLSDLKGKYVFLDFWASWCGPCRREFPFLKQAMTESENHDNFVILSFSLDKVEKEWKDCIEKNALQHKNWHHACDFKGWNSKAVELFAVGAVPYTLLLNPEGKVVAFNLRGEEMLKKVTAIMHGEESYE